MSILEVAKELAFWGPIILFCIGVPAALFNVILFIRVKKFRQSPTAYYVVGQSVFNIASLLLILLQSIPSTSTTTSSISCKLLIFVSQVIASTAMSFLCFVAFDRWACTSRSARIRQLSSIYVARRLCAIGPLIWSLISIPDLIFADLIPPIYSCGFTNQRFGQLITFFVYPFVSVILPLIILILFSILTYRNMRTIITQKNVQQNHARTGWSALEQQITQMMIVQTLLSVVCTAPRAILVIYVASTLNNQLLKSADLTVIQYLLDQVTLFIFGIIFASPFYVFVLSSVRFRKTINMLFKRVFNVEDNEVGSM